MFEEKKANVGRLLGGKTGGEGAKIRKIGERLVRRKGEDEVRQALTEKKVHRAGKRRSRTEKDKKKRKPC